MVAFVDVCNALFVTFVGAPLYFGAHVCLYAYDCLQRRTTQDTTFHANMHTMSMCIRM